MTTPDRIKRYQRKRAEQRQALSKIPCYCGCGALIPPITIQGKPARFKHGHNPGGEKTRFQQGQRAWNKDLPAPWSTRTHKGKPKSRESISKRVRTRKARDPNYGLEMTRKRDHASWLKSITAANQANAKFGPNNHFFGKRHSADARAKMSAKVSGTKHPNWHGGVGVLPYGPEFTRKFKRLIRNRDGHRCQRCGKTREEQGRTMQVHHLDHDKTHNDPLNLVTACNACNIWASYHRDEPFITQ